MGKPNESLRDKYVRRGAHGCGAPGRLRRGRQQLGSAITIKNPYSSYAVFPDNTIPTSLISPIAQKIMQYYPLPNRTALGNNYINAAHLYSNYNSFISRGDHRFNDKDSVTVTYGKRFAWSNQPNEESNLDDSTPPIRDDRELGGINLTHIFSPR